MRTLLASSLFVTTATLAACASDRGAGGSAGGGTGAGSGSGDSGGDDGGGGGEGSGGSATTGTSGGSGTTGGTTTGGTTTGGTTTGGTSATTGGDEGGLRFDVQTPDVPGGSASEGGPPGVGCSKVDFLFVVDNSGSMASEQQNLANSFPGFISSIQSNPQLQDFRILVIDTDSYFVANPNGTTITCSDPNCCVSMCSGQPDAVCNGVPCTGAPTGCDAQLGAGKTKSQADADCGVAGGIRYLTPTQPNLNTTFSCLAQVGTGGNGNEQQVEAALTALRAPMQGAGGCNEGFLRTDAILVVTIITDEEDGPEVGGDPQVSGPDTNSPGNAASWKSEFVALKNGDENAIVMLGLVGDTGLPSPICTPFDGFVGTGAENCDQLRRFADSFVYGQWNSVCAADYAPFFTEAVSVIESACDTFVPPG